MARTGRPRAFDVDQTVARAQDLFWSRGYSSTSVQDLVDELSVQRGSLYAAFGDKRGLYLKVVARYDSENRRRLESALAHGPVLPVLRRMLVDPNTLAGTGPDTHERYGCLVGNTTAELVPADAEASAVVAAAYVGFIALVTEALRRAQASGEVTTASPPEVQAQLVLLLFQGSALLSRAVPDDSLRNAALDTALGALRAPEEQQSGTPTAS